MSQCDWVNKPALAAAFSRAAHSYDGAAAFQRRCGERLLALLPAEGLGRKALDAGCGTGYFSRRLTAMDYRVTALDLAPGMLAQARQINSARDYLLADMENLPLSAGCVDLCFCNLAIQWCASLPRALSELMRVTRPGGRVVFSTLADGSLQELGTAWLQVDGRRHVNPFLSVDQIAAACAPYHHRLTFHQERCYFPDVLALMRSLKEIGATHLHEGRHGGLNGRQRLARLAQVYPRDAHGVALSYQLVVGELMRE
ncbi:malonyl-ACP O-methyltransferase BioC [Edwardsiella ictaluri]|uniref:Malonyl-[acyl-carrier protein] O-methyltransferase n=1 Tax=Edwardsiella ictaluri TaxID=67780 RepID=A0ABY8GHC3_EDWIC|nr:malonyl-ACP O-methyltransferase BioC [Edwardsiella ictaluri]ELV7529288.1 malonyl-ACP O-methyltransferase BioC [Edwardsiella ictaluri]KMQ77989.1 biotin biosynthesis protein BioC [Edwardsiella ictaluri]KOO54879.1 biotin biosynthesis protein BioC [Edwardsiella ictaluri]WFN96871.1 malonyl-ACP O-methyltransferase BioC [Edwardsiella ictaluri]